jgi:hypothetical protein
MLTLEQGKKLVKLARETIENYFKSEKFEIKTLDEFKEKRGVFVSIHTFPTHKLRGCVGFPYPDYPLYEALQRAAIESAFHDTRFPPLKQEELNKVVFEVSVLTRPKLIKVKSPKEYLKKIKIGKDGLIIEHGWRKGLLLPQVATEYKLSVQSFLEHLCLKAGLLPDFWLDEKTRIYKFQAQIFTEKEPCGEIIQT